MKRYIAILNQTGQSSPVATVLENSLGEVVWSRSSEGQYLGTLAGEFPAAKTFLVHGDGQGGEDGTEVAAELPQNSADYVLVTTKDIPSEGQRQFSDNLLLRTSIEIRVYE